MDMTAYSCALCTADEAAYRYCWGVDVPGLDVFMQCVRVFIPVWDDFDLLSSFYGTIDVG